jgi:hypothetical protein
MAASGGVQVIPEEIRVGIDRGDALRAGSNVDQGVSGGRADDLVDEAKDVQLNKIEVSARVEVAQDSDPCAEDLVKEDACFCGRNRGRGRAVKPGDRSQRREVRNNELGGSSLDETLDVDDLIDGRIDDVLMKRVFSLILGLVAR